jgi:hypothetical protein
MSAGAQPLAPLEIALVKALTNAIVREIKEAKPANRPAA